jgi:predicted nucleotidyltransferase
VVTISEIREAISDIVSKYPIKRISLFGSYASGTANHDSDIDLLVEFFHSNISLITLSSIKCEIEDRLNKKIDLIHYPVDDSAFINIDKVVDIYIQ